MGPGRVLAPGGRREGHLCAPPPEALGVSPTRGAPARLGERALHAAPRGPPAPGRRALTLPSQPRLRPCRGVGRPTLPGRDDPRPLPLRIPSGKPSRGVTRRCASSPGRAQAGEQGCHLAQALSCPHSSHTRRRGPWSTGRAAGLPPGPPPRQPKGRLGGGFIPLRAAVCHPRCPLNPLLIHSCVSGGVAHASDALPRRRSRPAGREALIDACAFPCGCQGAGHQLPEGL